MGSADVAGLEDAMTAVVEKFRTATIDGYPLRVTTDENRLVAPCVYIPLPDLAFRMGPTRVDVTWVVYLVANNSEADVATFNLAQLVDAVAGLFPFTSGATWLLSIPGGGTQTRAYQLTWSDKTTIGG